MSKSEMADVLLSPAASDPTSLQSPAAASAAAVERSKKHHRLNWLSWMRKSLTLGNKANQHRASGKLCACGFYHNYEEETKGLTTRSVFTTQMSSHHHQGQTLFYFILHLLCPSRTQTNPR